MGIEAQKIHSQLTFKKYEKDGKPHVPFMRFSWKYLKNFIESEIDSEA